MKSLITSFKKAKDTNPTFSEDALEDASKLTGVICHCGRRGNLLTGTCDKHPKKFAADPIYIAVRKGSKDEKSILKSYAKGIKPVTVHGIDIYDGGSMIVCSSPYFNISFKPCVVNKKYLEQMTKKIEEEEKSNL